MADEHALLTLHNKAISFYTQALEASNNEERTSYYQKAIVACQKTLDQGGEEENGQYPLYIWQAKAYSHDALHQYTESMKLYPKILKLTEKQQSGQAENTSQATPTQIALWRYNYARALSHQGLKDVTMLDKAIDLNLASFSSRAQLDSDLFFRICISLGHDLYKLTLTSKNSSLGQDTKLLKASEVMRICIEELEQRIEKDTWKSQQNQRYVRVADLLIEARTNYGKILHRLKDYDNAQEIFYKNLRLLKTMEVTTPTRKQCMEITIRCLAAYMDMVAEGNAILLQGAVNAMKSRTRTDPDALHVMQARPRSKSQPVVEIDGTAVFDKSKDISSHRRSFEQRESHKLKLNDVASTVNKSSTNQTPLQSLTNHVLPPRRGRRGTGVTDEGQSGVTSSTSKGQTLTDTRIKPSELPQIQLSPENKAVSQTSVRLAQQPSMLSVPGQSKPRSQSLNPSQPHSRTQFTSKAGQERAKSTEDESNIVKKPRSRSASGIGSTIHGGGVVGKSDSSATSPRTPGSKSLSDAQHRSNRDELNLAKKHSPDSTASSISIKQKPEDALRSSREAVRQHARKKSDATDRSAATSAAGAAAAQATYPVLPATSYKGLDKPIAELHTSLKDPLTPIVWFIHLRKYMHKDLLKYDDPKLIPADPIRIAILDSGLDIARPDIKSVHRQFKAFRDFTSDDNQTYHDASADEHGSNCASLLARAAPKALIYIAKVVPTASGSAPSVEALCSALSYIASPKSSWKIDIISMSCGITGYSSELRDEINRMLQLRKLVVVAAPNARVAGPKWKVFPAFHPSVLTINAWRPSYARSGAEHFTEKSDIIFPGEMVRILDDDGTPFPNTKPLSGTSFATPLAAGVAALLLDVVIRHFHKPGRSHPMFKLLCEPENMRAVFQSSSREMMQNRLCYFVLPWEKFGMDTHELSKPHPQLPGEIFPLLADAAINIDIALG